MDIGLHGKPRSGMFWDSLEVYPSTPPLFKRAAVTCVRWPPETTTAADQGSRRVIQRFAWCYGATAAHVTETVTKKVGLLLCQAFPDQPACEPSMIDETSNAGGGGGGPGRGGGL